MGSGLFISAEIWGGAGVIPQIQKDICLKIDEKNFDISKYSDDITNVGIIVNCFPDEMLIAGWGKPRKYISYKNGYADIRLPIPYVEFQQANLDKKYLMVVKNIIDSIAVIEERCTKSKRAKFNSGGMINEVLQRLKIKKEELYGINGVIQVMPK